MIDDDVLSLANPELHGAQKMPCPTNANRITGQNMTTGIPRLLLSLLFLSLRLCAAFQRLIHLSLLDRGWSELEFLNDSVSEYFIITTVVHFVLLFIRLLKPN